MPVWVGQAYGEYARRLPHECRLQLVEIPPAKRRKALPAARMQAEEGRQILAAIPAQARVVALDAGGMSLDSQNLATRVREWMQAGRDVALLVGGPDGLSRDCLARAELHWSLSALTFPHALVRVIIAEQLYRAWSILAGHPYHRP